MTYHPAEAWEGRGLAEKALGVRTWEPPLLESLGSLELEGHFSFSGAARAALPSLCDWHIMWLAFAV